MNTKHNTVSQPEVFRKIELTARRLKHIESMVMSSVGLTPAQYYIMTLLWESDKRPFKDLAEICSCSRATITGIIDVLEKKSLVKREQNPDDRRSFLALLTQKGQDLKAETPDMNEVFGKCCDCLNPAELKQLDDLLQKLYNSLQC